MKKFLSALLVLTLVFGACSLTACELLDGVLASLGYTKTTAATTPTVPDEPEFSKDLAFELMLMARAILLLASELVPTLIYTFLTNMRESPLPPSVTMLFRKTK